MGCQRNFLDFTRKVLYYQSKSVVDFLEVYLEWCGRKEMGWGWKATGRGYGVSHHLLDCFDFSMTHR